MPNLHLEYTANLTLDAHRCLVALNRTLAESGQFTEIDIKSRASKIEHFVIGTSPENRGFIHATLASYQGRADDAKRELTQRMLDTLKDIYQGDPGIYVQLVAEFVDIHRSSYLKAMRDLPVTA